MTLRGRIFAQTKGRILYGYVLCIDRFRKVLFCGLLCAENGSHGEKGSMSIAHATQEVLIN